jgi:hypothetical protein
MCEFCTEKKKRNFVRPQPHSNHKATGIALHADALELLQLVDLDSAGRTPRDMEGQSEEGQVSFRKPAVLHIVHPHIAHKQALDPFLDVPAYGSCNRHQDQRLERTRTSPHTVVVLAHQGIRDRILGEEALVRRRILPWAVAECVSGRWALAVKGEQQGCGLGIDPLVGPS